MLKLSGASENERSGAHEQLRTLDGTLRVGVVVLTVMLLSSPWGGGWEAGFAMYGTGVALHALHWLWLRAYPSRWVAISHCLLYFVWVTAILALRAGGMVAPAAFVYPPLVLMAGLVWSGRAAIGMAVLTSVAGAVLAFLQSRGELPEPVASETTPYRLWLVMTACVAVTAALIRYALGTLKRNNEDRLNNERRVADLVRASPDTMLFVDERGIVRGANPALSRRFGVAPEVVEGQRLSASMLFDSESLAAVHEQLAATLADGTPRNEEHIAIDPRKGASAAVEVYSYRVNGGSGEALVCLNVRDLSEREQRRRLEERLKEGQRLEALGRLAGGVAHDFNNLLMVILASTELLKRMQRDGSRELTAIEDAAKRAALLTRQLLAFGRRQVLVAEAVELNRAVQQVSPLLERLLHAEIKLVVRRAPVDCYAVVDRSQLDQILINLIANARDAMPGGGTVTLECGSGASGGASSAGDTVWFSVSDTGAGIAPELQDRIFEPFFTTKRDHGTGLGLSTVHGIVTQSGGTIRVQSKPGVGTTFIVTLPRATEVQPAPERKSAEPPRRSSAHVLVVDDESAVRLVLRAILESGGHRVVSAESASAALAAMDAEGAPFDLLLTDVVMSEMNGPQLAARARERQPRLQVLYTSGHTADLLDARGALQSREHFIGKPFTSIELLRRVDELLGKEARSALTAEDFGQPS